MSVSSKQPWSLPALASLVTRNLMPVLGVLFLGWSAPNLLALYFIDTLLAFAAVMLLVMGHITGMGEGKGLPNGVRDWTRLVAATAMVMPFVAIPLGMPIFLLFAEFGISSREMLDDPNFRYGLWMQALLSAQAFIVSHRDLSRRDDDDEVLKHRVQYILVRWIAVIAASMTGLVSLLGPHFGGIVMLVVYAAASVYAELFPERVDAWLNPPKPTPSPPTPRRKSRPRRR